jgi:hypothetical protein
MAICCAAAATAAQVMDCSCRDNTAFTGGHAAARARVFERQLGVQQLQSKYVSSIYFRYSLGLN